ncbi:MAG: hypothetical protein ABIZ05_15490, partial [Pseudonocardiaceae bacterium]
MSVTDRNRRDVDPIAGSAGGPARRERPHGRSGPYGRSGHRNRQLTALACVGLFFFGPTIVHGVGIHAARFENRALATFGDPREGWAWLTGLPAWAADNLPLRDSAVRATEALS